MFFALLVEDGKFYTLRNLENILRQSCVYATAGLGMTMIIIAAGIDLGALNFRYRLSGDKPDWRPIRVFDDGRQTFVEFGGDIATGEMPPLFATGAKGEAELLNYRVQRHFMIVDRLFERGELRLGAGRAARKVIIERLSRPRERS